MSYIGKQPVPQSLQSRQQFTGDGSTTTFATIGGVELYEDVFLNGVRLSRVDNEYSFDGTTLTITPAPANGDTVSIILRNDHSDLVALPITDSQGNNVLSESGSVVTLTADEANVGSNALVVDSSGNVSIGTSDPGDYRLKVENSGGNKGAAYISSTGSNCWGLEIGTHSATSESDLVFTSNAVVGSQASVSFVTDSPSGLWRWMTGGTSHKTGTDGATEVVRIDSSGNVGIGDSTPDAALDVVGNIHYTGTITDVSDRRLKENITDLTDSLNKVSQLEGKSYTLIADRGNEGDTTEYGFIAQNVQEVFPEAVKVIQKYAVDENGEPTEEELNYLGVSYIQLIAPMVEAIKELKAKNEAFESQINALTARIEALEATP